MKPSVFSVFLVVVTGCISVMAIEPEVLIQRHRQAVNTGQTRMEDIYNVAYLGTVVRYGLQGNAGIFSTYPDRAAVGHFFTNYSERMSSRGRQAESIDLPGTKRVNDQSDIIELKALQFMLAYLYLRPEVALPANVQEQASGISARFLTPENIAIDVQFDPSTWLIKTFSFSKENETVQYTLENFGLQVNGILYPSRISRSGANPVTYSIREVNVNQSIDSAEFGIPNPAPAFDLIPRNTPRLPFQLYYNLPVTKAYIGNYALNFLIDTGLPFSVLDQRIVNQLGYAPEGKYNYQCRYPAAEFSMVRLPSFMLRELECKNHLFFVTNMIPVSSNVQMPIHGILGADMFQQAVLHLDYIGESFRVIPAKGFTASGDWRRIPLGIRNGVAGIVARVGDVDIRLELSTSLGDSILLAEGSPLARALAVRNLPHTGAISTGLQYGLAETVYNTGTVSLGVMALNKVLVHCARFPEGHSLAARADGWLGNGILGRFGIYIDFSENALYLENTPNYDRSDFYNRSGMYFIKSGGKLVVHQVLADSPAAKAGIQPNDVLVQIMDYQADQIVFDRLYRLFSGESGTALTIKIVRGQEELVKELQLQPAF